MDATRIASLHYPPLQRQAARALQDWRRVELLRQLLRRHLPATTAALFARAEPVAAQPGRIDWYSDLAGEPVVLAELPEDQRQEILRRIEQRLHSIRRLAEQRNPTTAADADAEAWSLLQRAARYPHPNCVYLVDGEPVLTYWGLDAPPARRADPGPIAEPPHPPTPWQRWRPALLGLVAMAMIGALAMGAWQVWQQRVGAQLQQDLTAGLAANCTSTAVLRALHARLQQIDPEGKRFPVVRLDTQRELDRCADAADLDAALSAAWDDCAALPAVADALFDQDVSRPPLSAIDARLRPRLSACATADELMRRLDDARGDCDAMPELEWQVRALDAATYPLADPIAEIAAEAAACRLHAELMPLLQAAAGDCIRLRELDRDFRQRLAAAGQADLVESLAADAQMSRPRPAPLDLSRPLLNTLREQMDRGLRRCQLADHLTQRLVAANDDCIELSALRATMARQGDAAPPFADLRARIDEALGQCAALSELEATFAQVQDDCPELAAFAEELAGWRDNLRFADIRARTLDARAICTRAEALERRIAGLGLQCDALNELESTLSATQGAQFDRARGAFAAKRTQCAKLQGYARRLTQAGSHCGRLKQLRRDLERESAGYLKSIHQRLAKAFKPCVPKPKPNKPNKATGARGAGAYALRGACNGSLTIAPASGYHQDRVRHIVRIAAPANARIAKVVSDNRGCRNCRLHKRNATTWSVGLYYNCSGRGAVPIAYSAYDRGGRLICSGKGIAHCLGRR
ncbi:MAG TPA: hypothetical protein DIW77_16315 [Chromatiaceae bacterium]|nr:hypothetical protein [Chromatiaceae bacterium]